MVDKSNRKNGRRNTRTEGRRSAPRSSGRRDASSPTGETSSEAEEIRLNKYIARAGLASRRKADTLIEQGRVRVNGAVVTELGTRVSESDRVEVNGRVISPQEHLYILLNKPSDTITTTQDERGRDTVLDLVELPEEEKGSLFPVGRLDRHTVGTLLLTNDGELAHRLMHPSYEITKIYRVETKEPVKPHELDLLRKGVALEDGVARADRVTYLDPQNHHYLGLQLHEGRNRQIRRMLEALGHEVVFLERVQYAGLTTKGVRRGKWRKLDPREVQRLRRLTKLT